MSYSVPQPPYIGPEAELTLPSFDPVIRQLFQLPGMECLRLVIRQNHGITIPSSRRPEPCYIARSQAIVRYLVYTVPPRYRGRAHRGLGKISFTLREICTYPQGIKRQWIEYHNAQPSTGILSAAHPAVILKPRPLLRPVLNADAMQTDAGSRKPDLN